MCQLPSCGQRAATIGKRRRSFREIANKPGQTAGGLFARIILPKHLMPQIPLEKSELTDLAAYIMSLRDQP